ncbi:hypothetical protein [Streptomyces sp. NPDC055140]
MTLTTSAPRRARPATVAYSWWWTRTAGKESVLNARSLVINAERDVHLVLGDDRPLPAQQSEVDQLLIRFSDHLEGLLRAVSADAEADVRFSRARRVGRLPRPLGHMESRIHLVMAAESVQDLLVHVRSEGARPAKLRMPRGWWPLAHRFPLPPADARWARSREVAHV